MEYKGFNIVRDGTMGMHKITQPGSGAMPSALKGSYTEARYAVAAIDAYKPKRGAKNHVKANTTADV
ncbi:hypothetical protein NVP1253O_15 [Vibrio phage 1.253.O._10N.286.45.B12]|nr:hypothetical protein NVP1235O_15 [Vibrio phage 1.235.O._10N.261.52.B2]AUR98539.1 hypothetical protein NVP1253O_15 [Vibrio phage 1.253.O._10N.286.45.B12]